MFSQTRLPRPSLDVDLPRACATTLSLVDRFFLAKLFSEKDSQNYEGRTAFVAVRPSRIDEGRRLLHVLADQLCHLEHRDLAAAAEDDLELVVSIDHAALLGILESVPLDVLPQ